MRLFADLHLHGPHSRGTSPTQTLADLDLWAGRKGVGLLGTGDATHPLRRAELEEKLEPAGGGLFRLKGGGRTLFVLQGEVSCIAKEAGRTRKVHVLAYFQNFDELSRFSAALAPHAKLGSDGRPIAKIPPRSLLAMLLDSAPGSVLIPAHIWTPWYSLLGEKSGYDSVEECFGDLAGHIPALETGLSADPAMCRRLSSLDRFGLVSSSDAHSPAMIGREATEFDIEPAFDALFAAMRPGAPGLLSTVEFYPELGKYHREGHRKCGVREGIEGKCPVCGKTFTGGVAERIGFLADRETGLPDRPFNKVVPLANLLAAVLGVGPASKAVQRDYFNLLAELGPELYILRSAAPSDLAAAHSPDLAGLIEQMRAGTIEVEPGYDGRYGRVRT